jgi:hypothetical protein
MKESDKSIFYGIFLGFVIFIFLVLIIKCIPNNQVIIMIYLILLMIFIPFITSRFYRNKYGKNPKIAIFYRNSILSAFESFAIMIAIIFVYVSYLSSPVPVPEITLIQVFSIIFVVWFIVFFITWKYREPKKKK